MKTYRPAGLLTIAGSVDAADRVVPDLSWDLPVHAFAPVFDGDVMLGPGATEDVARRHDTGCRIGALCWRALARCRVDGAAKSREPAWCEIGESHLGHGPGARAGTCGASEVVAMLTRPGRAVPITDCGL